MDDDNHIEELACLRAEVNRLRKALNNLSPAIDVLLKRRGFSIYKKEPAMKCLRITARDLLFMKYLFCKNFFLSCLSFHSSQPATLMYW